MYKQRDNEYYPPMTSDPTGGGTVSSAFAALNNTNANNGNGNENVAFGATAVAAGSRKRGRDIRGIERFRNVVYGEDGFRRLHGMVARNPSLMYLPEGVDEARARVAERRRAALSEQQQQEQQQQTLNSAGGARANERDDNDVFALFEERKAAEMAETTTRTTTAATDAETAPPELPAPPQPASLMAIKDDEELANHHHKQLDSFLRLVYEFNHVTFMKLPMEDTLQLLSRCGKEAVAHVVEYETQVRLKRQARLRELFELQREKRDLAKRRRDAEDAEEARLLAAAQQRQAELDLAGLDHPPEASVEADAAEDLLPSAPQVRFVLGETVKEEKDEVKDTDLVETVVCADVQLPLLGEIEAAEENGSDERAPLL